MRRWLDFWKMLSAADDWTRFQASGIVTSYRGWLPSGYIVDVDTNGTIRLLNDKDQTIDRISTLAGPLDWKRRRLIRRVDGLRRSVRAVERSKAVGK